MLSDTDPRLGWLAVNSTSSPLVMPAQPAAWSWSTSTEQTQSWPLTVEGAHEPPLATPL